MNPTGSAIWDWPDQATASKHRSTFKMAGANCSYDMVPAQALLQVFLAKNGEIHKRIFGNLLPQPRGGKHGFGFDHVLYHMMII